VFRHPLFYTRFSEATFRYANIAVGALAWTRIEDGGSISQLAVLSEAEGNVLHLATRSRLYACLGQDTLRIETVLVVRDLSHKT
jgi:hypothetical protein